MVTLEVVVHTPHSLKVIELLGGLTFTSCGFTRENGTDEFLLEGDEAMLTEPQRRMGQSISPSVCGRKPLRSKGAPSAQSEGRRLS